MAVIQDGAGSTLAGVNTNNEIKVVTSETRSGVAFFSENDNGAITGTRYLSSPETDDDFRLRTAMDNILDTETFNYTAQNTGKFNYITTTMTTTWTTAGMTTNGSAITTTGTGTRVRTYAYFPVHGTAHTYVEYEGSYNVNYLATNQILDIGLFIDGGTTPFTPTDGVFFRTSSSGVFGVINFNGSETATSAFTFTPTANRKYQFIISVTEREVEFWIDNQLYASVATPPGQGQPFLAASLPFAVRHANTGTASAAAQFILNDYSVTINGAPFADTWSSIGNRMLGSYQGLSGGTMGSLANYANSANPTAAVPTNTTAALGTGLGGQFWETASLAVNTDGVICSYQNPAGTVSVQGRRLVIKGVSLFSYIQTVIVGGPYVSQYSLAFGHTAVALNTSEAATTKAPRRIALPAFTQLVTAAQAVSTLVSQPGGSYIAFDNPVYVNPGEFVALVTKHVGTVGTSGTVAHVVAFDYGWE